MNETIMSHDRAMCRVDDVLNDCVGPYETGSCADSYIIVWGDFAYKNRKTKEEYYKFQCKHPDDQTK
jgi:hypothetical protein